MDGLKRQTPVMANVISQQRRRVMIRALRVTMIVFGTIGILAGLSWIIIPVQAIEMYGFEQLSDYVRWFMALGGSSFVAAGVWVIIAARDPLRHISWVKFVILKSLLFVAVTAYSIIRGYVDFSQVGVMLIAFTVLAAAFLAFYPWSVVRSKQQKPVVKT